MRRCWLRSDRLGGEWPAPQPLPPGAGPSRHPCLRPASSGRIKTLKGCTQTVETSHDNLSLISNDDDGGRRSFHAGGSGGSFRTSNTFQAPANKLRRTLHIPCHHHHQLGCRGTRPRSFSPSFSPNDSTRKNRALPLLPKWGWEPNLIDYASSWALFWFMIECAGPAVPTVTSTMR